MFCGVVGLILTESSEQECNKQHKKAGAVGMGRTAVHPVLLTDAHLYFDLCVAGQGGHSWVRNEQRELVVGFLQTVQKHDLGVCGCRRHRGRGKLCEDLLSALHSCMHLWLSDMNDSTNYRGLPHSLSHKKLSLLQLHVAFCCITLEKFTSCWRCYSSYNMHISTYVTAVHRTCILLHDPT